ncbi:MAG: carboxypeptidase-like regulatory domain-containing protein [Pyrinomonadaceae bacterium]|nr:carboxypeptidase-like regulatory domain-containing protein [Acidobacteriota bacterium]
MRKFVFAAILSTVAFFPAFAQQRVSNNASLAVDGRVVDVNGAALPGATVSLRQSAGGFERTVTTDSRGSFHFADLTRGQYRISARILGFSDVTEEIALTASKQEVELTLQRGTISETLLCQSASSKERS